MSITQAADLRNEILLQLYAARPLAMSAKSVARAAIREGIDCSPGDTSREAEYLAGLGLVEAVVDPISNATTWKLTSKGVQHYETRQKA